ncbi:hypothetical protein LTR36_006210 [Oleoguttula mirabilis]|uniref:Uncharacterized protein n=1 Tax=Oleoguttula mirabilis TaxID=1507867 RepID=A0AAV9JC85_9PEZI|nr:hypothetical protein LTR36_006210 [Oleoguttula mirabilis]
MEPATDGAPASCPLPSLAPELRNIIYQMVLTVPPDDNGAVTISCASPSRNRDPSVLSILQTCRQARDEAQAIFYHNNHLRCYHHNLGLSYPTTKVQFNFLGTISPTRRAAIRAMTVIISEGHEATRAAKVMQSLPGLKTLYLEMIACGEYIRCLNSLLADEEALLAALKGVKGLVTVKAFLSASGLWGPGLCYPLNGLESRLQGYLNGRSASGEEDDA